MRSSVFDLTTIELAGCEETVLAGGRHLFPRLPAALHGVRRVGVIGWGSQGRAQAQNLRESLEGTEVQVTVGLRRASPSWAEASALGFSEADGTLGEMYEVIATSDLALLLVSDAALAANHRDVFAALRPAATLGLSHGFLLEHLRSIGGALPREVNVVAVCPKGMGPSVRRLYEQGRTIDGAGINASIAVHQDLDGWATDRALAWAVAIGAPFIFETTLEDECRSDLVGERAVLLGAAHAVVETLFRYFVARGDSDEAAFVQSAECVTGPLSAAISHTGLRGVAAGFDADGRRVFDDAYDATYPAALAVVAEIYDEVACGNELRSVVLAGARADRFPMAEIDRTHMWEVGRKVRARRDERPAVGIHPLTAGMYCAVMMAQVDLLAERGHRWSEIANESVIEAVDSLNPFMHARGVGHMVDSCSVTARLGARRWGPRFEAALAQSVLPALDGAGPADRRPAIAFRHHPIHEVLDVIGAYRPSVDIAVA